MNKRILAAIMCIAMIFCLTSCDMGTNNDKNKTNNAINDEVVNKYLEETKNMDEADFLTFAEEYANSAKPIYVMQKVVDSKIDLISKENYDTVRQAEWVNIIFNIAKFQDLFSIYSYGLDFNDDNTINYESSINQIDDEIFEVIYENMTKNGLKLMRRNDEPYVTTDVEAFLTRVGDVQEAFKEYLQIVNEIDKHDFLRNGVINYDNLAHCMAFSDEFIKNKTDDKIWETVYQQYYYQVMMYTGLYGYGGFVNEDNSFNTDYEEIVNRHISENPNTIFTELMTDILQKVKEASTQEEFNIDKVQSIVDAIFEEKTQDYFYDFYEKIYPSQYAEMKASQEGESDGHEIIDNINPEDGTGTDIGVDLSPESGSNENIVTTTSAEASSAPQE